MMLLETWLKSYLMDFNQKEHILLVGMHRSIQAELIFAE